MGHDFRACRKTRFLSFRRGAEESLLRRESMFGVCQGTGFIGTTTMFELPWKSTASGLAEKLGSCHSDAERRNPFCAETLCFRACHGTGFIGCHKDA